MPAYEILPHTADYKIRAYGITREELFANAMRGMFANYKAADGVPQIRREIKVEAGDIAALLVDFLSEALVLSDSNNEVYTDVAFTKFSDVELEGTLVGTPLKDVEGDEIKAVTYYGLEVKQREDRVWETTIIFDI